jgi:hypothetical protein
MADNPVSNSPIGDLSRSDWVLIRDALDCFDDENSLSIATERAVVLSESLSIVLDDRAGVYDYESVPNPEVILPAFPSPGGAPRERAV